MNCRQVDKWIDAALDEGLTGERRARFDAHLEACPRCRSQWELLRVADAALRAPRPVPAPEGMLTEFRQRVAQEEAAREVRRTPRLGPWFWPVASFAAAGAAAALVMGLNLAPAGGPLHRAERPQAPPASVPMAKTDPGPRPEPRVPLREKLFAEQTGPTAPAPAPATEAARTRPVQAPPHRPSATQGTKAAEKVAGERPTRMALVTPPPPVSPSGEPRMRLRLQDGPSSDLRANFGRGVTADAAEPRAGAAPSGGLGVGGLGGGGLAAGNAPREPALPDQAPGNRDADSGPIAMQASTQLVQSEILPPEFNVSPAVLTALRRPVQVEVDGAPVREALARLTESADVMVRIDPSIQPLRVSVQQEGTPLWVALQAVAQQGKLKILPEDNHLVLRPQEAAPPAPAGPRARLETPPLSRPNTEKRLKPLSPAGQRKEQERQLRLQARSAPVPDPAVWPAAWGELPRNGFEPPRPEELPLAIAELPQAMDEARQNDGRQTFYNRQLEPGPAAKQNAPASKKSPGGSR